MTGLGVDAAVSDTAADAEVVSLGVAAAEDAEALASLAAC
jgi:hypothetical protein